MAARLVKQCACLLREAAHLAPAGPPAGRLSLASVAHKTLTSSATSPSSHFPASVSQHLEKEPVTTPYPERQEVDELIEKASEPEELLGLLPGGHSLRQNQAALALIRLSRLLAERPADKASLVQDARFQQLLQLVNSQVGPGCSGGNGRAPRPQQPSVDVLALSVTRMAACWVEGALT